MPRERDPFWRHVTLLNKENSKWKCNFCGQVNSGGATRIKAHLAGITRYGIKGCEGVDVEVNAEAREVLMPKKKMDSSDQGVPEERIEGNVRVAPTSTSNPPNVEGGTNLQSAQGAPPLTPQTHGLMKGVVQAEGEVHIANLPWAGATSFSSASPPSESFFDMPDDLSTLYTKHLGLETLNAQQNPCAPLPSQNRQLLDNTFQNESQGSILLASDTQLTTMATIYTPRQSNQSHQSFHRQGGHGTGVSPPRESMDIEPLFPSQPFNEPLISKLFNSPSQIPGDIIDSMNPSTSEGVSPWTPQTRTNQRVQDDRLVYIASLLLDGATSSSSASPRLNSFSPDSPNELLPNISQSLTLDAQQNRTAPLPSQNRPLLTNTSQNESQGSILPGPIESNTQLTNMATTYAPQHSSQTHQSFHRQCGCGTGLSPPRDSMDIEPPIPSQPGPPIIEPRNSPPQIPEDIINTTGPSTSEVQPASVPPQDRSFPHQAPNNAPSPPQIQRCGTGLIGTSSLRELDMNKGAPLTSHTNTNNNFEKSGALKRKINRLYNIEVDIRDELEFAASLSLKKQRMEVKNWLADVEKLRNDFHSIEPTSEDCLPSHQQVDTLMQEAEDLMEQGKFPKGLFVVREIKVNKLLERKLVGEAFQRNTTKILEYLVGNQISRLGIYGMGGVGKTTLMVHVYNRLLEKTNYGDVLWITVSQDFNTEKLQDDISKALDLGKLEDDVRKRAAKLSDALTKIEKLIIILDDVWEYFDLKEVGIPVRADGLKLVLTTRSFNVCCQMHCQEKMKIEPLSREEAESLFFEELGSEVALNLETEAIVKSIVKECAGLPLGVITMAASMRGVTDVFEWKDCLVKLKESDMGQTEMEKVLMKLRVSYNRLGNHEVQQCFLSCALYPEDELIEKVELIEFFIDQGLICGLNTREKEYDRGFTILNKLENVCLLEDYGEKMKMHDLIRDMALSIMSATSIIRARKQLTRIPPEEYWTNSLEKVSLMENEISEFPLNMSPNCPKLSTLLLNKCLSGKAAIPDSFFKNLLGLEVLNLSRSNVPNSISNLVNLRALLLRNCWLQFHNLYLGKLTSLRKLDIRDCQYLGALKGLEKLVNLRYLLLINISVQRLPKGILDHLLNLQCLIVSAVYEENITKLGALETFACYLKNANDFNECVRVIEQSDNPRYYHLTVIGSHPLQSGPPSPFIRSVYLEARPNFIVGVSDDTRSENVREVWASDSEGNLGRSVEIECWDHAIVCVGGECTGICIWIPRDVRTIKMDICDGMANLSGMGPLEYLEELKILKCDNLGVLWGGQDEEVINIPASTLAPLLFPSLRVLEIYQCTKLKYLFGHGFKSILPHLQKIRIYECYEMVGIIAAVTSPPPHPLPFFPSLEHIMIRGCDKMKRAVESEWMPHLPTLKRIEVSYCEEMEEIIGGPPPYLPVEGISLESLGVETCDNMRKLFPHEWLLHVRNLQSVEVTNCDEMVEMISGARQGQEGSLTTPVNSTPSSFQPPISLPKLERLKLCLLPQLKSICEVPISCDSMKELTVYTCPELKGIPLQLRLREIKELPYIWVEDEEKWKTLMWDHSNAQAILQPYLRKGEHANDRFPWIPPPNAIELSTKGKDLQRLCS